MNNEQREQQMMDLAMSAELNSRTIDISKKQVFMSAYIQGWKDADSHPQWIPVEKTNQLPPKIEGEEITEYYWVAGLYGRWYDVLRYDYRDGRWSDHYGNYHACVTHWMPIVPPQGKEE